MADFDLVLRGRRVITRAGEVPRCIAVRDGVVVAIEPLESRLEGAETVDLADDEVLLPGLVDTHVHVNEPGRTEWEGFATATRAAAAGGVTTILDMPLNSIPPTTTVDGLEVKRKAAQDSAHVDVGFWGGAIPGNIDDLRGLHDAGVFGFKCFMTDSGVEEFPPLSADQLEEYLGVLASYGAKMIVHAEDSTAIERAPAPHGRHYSDFLASRPRGSENVAIAHLIEAARHTGASVHLLHLSSSDAVPMLRTARREGIRMTVETCPHYLVFEAEAIADGATQFKCCPPIREIGNREELWARAGPRRHRLRRVRPLAVHRRAQAARRGRVRRGVGRHLVAADRAARRVDRGPAARPHARRRGPVDVAAARRDRPAAAQGPHRARLPRRLRRVRAGRRVRRRPDAAAPPQPRHPVRASARWPASSAAPGCAAAGSPATSRGGR